MAKRIQLNEAQLRKMIKEAISEKGKWSHVLFPDNAGAAERLVLRKMNDIQKEYGDEMFGQALRRLYENGKIEIPAEIYEKMKNSSDEDFGWAMETKMRNGEFFLPMESMELVEKYCKTPYFWEEEEEGDEVSSQLGLAENKHMAKRIQLSEAQLKRIIAESVKTALRMLER